MGKKEKTTLEPEQWVDRYGDFLYNYAVIRVSDAEKAADLVQETFLAGLRAAGGFQGKSSERTWLVSILKRKIVDHYRKQYASKESSFGRSEEDFRDGKPYREDGPHKGHWNEGMGPHSNSLLPEGKLEQEELMKIIGDCISRLPPNLESVFVMKMIDETESEKICKELGITPSNLWVMLHRARLRLRQCVVIYWMKS